MLESIKQVSAIATLIFLFLMILTGGWLLLVELMDQGAFSYACYGFLVSASGYFLLELYKRSR